MQQHVETMHSEGRSPFVVQDDKKEETGVGGSGEAPPVHSDHDSEDYLMCEVDGCGEWLVAAGMKEHLQLHSDQLDLESVSSARTPGTSIASRSSKTLPTVAGNGASAPRIDSRAENRRPGQEAAAVAGAAHRPRSDGDSASRRQTHAIKIWKNIFNMPLAKTKSRQSGQSGQPLEPPPRGKRLGVSLPFWLMRCVLFIDSLLKMTPVP
jgi:hypothetical protein